MKKLILISYLLAMAITTIAQQIEFPILTGPYLGQKSPGLTPELFAPGIMTNDVGYHTPIVFSPDLKEAFWLPMIREERGLFYSKIENGKWTNPVEMNFGLENGMNDPFFSVDGQKIYFLSFQPDSDGKNERERIWYSEKEPGGWSKAKLIDKVVYDHPTHWTFSLAANGNLYFTSEKSDSKGVCIAKYDGSKYLAPQKLFDGSMPFIARDESYIIYVIKNEDTKTDLYIRYKEGSGSWTAPIDMGPKVNSDAHDLAPYVSPDGKYLFFISQRERPNGIMWMSAGIIEELKPKEKK